MYLYNSMSHKKELFTPIDPKLVKMYTCGPTVYHFAHIGNLRSYIMEDVLEKSLRYMGYPVKRVMNITRTRCSRVRAASIRPSWRSQSSILMRSSLTVPS